MQNVNAIYHQVVFYFQNNNKDKQNSFSYPVLMKFESLHHFQFLYICTNLTFNFPVIECRFWQNSSRIYFFATLNKIQNATNTLETFKTLT